MGEKEEKHIFEEGEKENAWVSSNMSLKQIFSRHITVAFVSVCAKNTIASNCFIVYFPCAQFSSDGPSSLSLSHSHRTALFAHSVLPNNFFSAFLPSFQFHPCLACMLCVEYILVFDVQHFPVVWKMKNDHFTMWHFRRIIYIRNYISIYQNDKCQNDALHSPHICMHNKQQTI